MKAIAGAADAVSGHAATGDATARAVAFHVFGGPEVLRTIRVATPPPAHGELRVRVKAAGVQPIDCALRAGRLSASAAFPIAFPQCLGNEFAGIVEAVGEGVHAFAPGDEVIGWKMMACHAESIAVDARNVVMKPRAMPWDEAGCLSASGQTAHTALRTLGVGAGDTVLIHAAAGGVGSLAVQLARAWGARVIGTASVANHDFLRALGAEPVAYGDGLVDRVRALAPYGVTAALDAAGGEAIDASLALVDDRRRIATLVDFARAGELGIVGVRSLRTAMRLNELVNLWTSGMLRVPIRARYALDNASEAHRDVERRHGYGKVALMIEVAA